MPEPPDAAVLDELIGFERTFRKQAHGRSQQLVLDRTQHVEHLLGAARVGQLDRALEDDGPSIDARVDEVDCYAEDLYAVRERLLDGAQAGARRQQRGVDVDDRAGKT